MSNIFNNWNSASNDERLELVFENRNKAYGAYKIRKEFSKNQILAMLIAIGFAFLLSGGALAYNVWQAKQKPKTKVKVVTRIETLDDIEEPDEELPEPEPEMKEPEPQVETQAYTVPTINETAKTDDVELFDPSKIESPSNTTKDGIKDPFANFDPNKIKSPANTGSGDGPVKVAIEAKYPGGEAAFAAFLQDNFIYPERCKQEGINGSVLLQFIVDVNGRVSNVKALDETKSCPEFTEEAVRVIRKSVWIAGNTNGKFFKSYRKLPIQLSIVEE